jgi:hypothetical protein
MRRAFCSILAAATIAAALVAAGPARAQCTGWPVVCTGVPPAGGVAGGGMGGAMGAVGIGIGLLGILQQMDQPPPPQPPADAVAPGPVPGAGSYGAAPAAPGPSVEAQKSAILMQMHPLSIGGSYGATSPSAPASISADAQPSSLVNPIAPPTATGANSDGGAGLSAGDPGQAWKSSMLKQMRPLNGTDEAASANARAPFDTAGNPAHSAADQLCQAAGAGNGCIGRPGAGSAEPNATAGSGAVAVAGAGAGLMVPPSPRLVCGARLDIAEPVALGAPASASGRAAGFPIASSLDQLRSFDYSDIKANLAAMNPEQLARMKVASAQEAARLEATIDAIKVKLFAAGLGAASPVGPLLDVANDALLETASDELPFWRQMAALAQKQPRTRARMPPDEQHAAAGDALDQVDTSVDGMKKLAALIDKFGQQAKDLPPERAGTPTLAFGLGHALVEGILAHEAARKGDRMRASAHTGNALQALSPLAELLLPEEWLPFLSKAEGMQQTALIAIDLAVHYREGAKARSQALDAQAANQALSLALRTRVDALKGKLRDIRNLQQAIAQEPRCA